MTLRKHLHNVAPEKGILMAISDLISSGITRKPLAIMLHGEHGVGKTTFGSTCPNPIFVTGEEIEEVPSDKFPKCQSFEDFEKYLSTLLKEDHNYQTLVIDTIDSIEELLFKKIVKDGRAANKKVTSIETACGGYGKGYVRSAENFIRIRENYLVPLREQKNMHIVLLCHTTRTTTEDPVEDDFRLCLFRT